MYQQTYETECGFYQTVAGSSTGSSASVAVDRALANPNTLSVDGPKISALISPTPTPEELLLLLQMGVTHCFTWIELTQATKGFVAALAEQVRLLRKFNVKV